MGQITGGNHVKGSLHYQGRAVDFGTAGHSPGQVMALWQALVDKFGTGMNELFYDPAGRYIDAHRWITGAIGGHGDHIHAGFRKGGKWLGSFARGWPAAPDAPSAPPPEVDAGPDVVYVEVPTMTPEELAAIQEQTDATNRLADLTATQNANQLKILALANQGPQIIAATVAAVSGGIGGQVGLGFQSPSYAGGMARYS
jgi:hypothetical protein